MSLLRPPEPLRLAALALTMAVVVLLSGGWSMYLLYDTAIDEQRARLLDAVKNHARLIEAVARHAAQEPVRTERSAADGALAQVIDAHARSAGFGRTGEYVLARQRGDRIIFVLSHRHGEPGERHPQPLPIDGVRGAPMRLALAGQSGTLIGIDYRGVTVLAAHEPVAILDMGLVAKIDLAEIRAPFIRAALHGGAVAVLAILLSAFLFIRATMPLVHRIRETEAYNRTIVESAADGIATIDARGRITSFNPACVTIFQRAQEDALGRAITELLPGFDADDHVRREVTGVRGDGTEVALEVSVSELASRERGQHALLVRDVSERRRLEAELRHAQKMEAIGTLASGIAHDFNNLLMGIATTTEVALKQAADGPVLDHLARIKSSALSGASITRSLLAFGRRGEPISTSLELNDVVADTKHMLRHILGTDVDLQVTLSPERAAIVGDRGEVEQILLNLAGNARHAMPSGGKLSIAVSKPVVDGNEFVLLTVTDTGLGMSEETRARIFEPFFTTKDEGAGTGLGLSSVYAIVDHQGGRVEVDSELGAGTTFRLYWPATERANAQEEAAPAADELRGSEGVLLVEDEKVIRQSIKDHLERAGYTVFEAASAKAARQVLAKHRADIDLLLTDIVMKGGSGAELASQVGALPVVFMSAHPTDKLVRDGTLAPGTRSLQKPFTEYDLLNRLREVFGAIPTRAGARAPSDSTLLLVEDDTGAREACHELLSDLGYRVIAAENGAEAVTATRLQGDAIDLVLADLGLPDMSCTELMTGLAVQGWDGAVIFLSGRGTEDAELRALLEHPRRAFIQKPIDFDAVVTMIERLTTQPRMESDDDAAGGKPPAERVG